MAAIKFNKNEDSDTIRMQSNLGLINEIYSGKNKWLISRMDGTKAMKWRPKKEKLEEGL